MVIECSYRTETIPSCPLSNNRSFEINQRMVFVMRVLGIRLCGLNIFCGLMDLCTDFTMHMYYSTVDNIYTVAQAVLSIKSQYKKRCKKQEIEENAKAGNGSLHLSVSDNGTWNKRGSSSLFGIITLIGKYTNKVLDVVIKSSFCSLRENDDSIEKLLWQEEHEKECTINHSGSIEKMKVNGIIEMFQRSQDLHSVKYENYIGDGDSKTFKSLLNKNPYRDELSVKKKNAFDTFKSTWEAD